MKYEIHNGDYLGTVEWRGPGQVAIDMEDNSHREWFQDYFSSEDSCLSGHAYAAEMSDTKRRDETEATFEHAAYHLAAYAFEVRRGDGSRYHRGGK